MGVRHAEQEQLERLAAKTLEAQLRQILISGLACSPFEAEAVLGAVHEVYAPFFHGMVHGWLISSNTVDFSGLV